MRAVAACSWFREDGMVGSRDVGGFNYILLDTVVLSNVSIYTMSTRRGSARVRVIRAGSVRNCCGSASNNRVNFSTIGAVTSGRGTSLVLSTNSAFRKRSFTAIRRKGDVTRLVSTMNCSTVAPNGRS